MEFELIKPEEQDLAPFFSVARARQAAKEERDADVADVVHFWDGTECRAAIVGGVNGAIGGPDRADLMVLWFDLDKGLHWGQALDAEHSEAKRISTWHWPCGGH